MTQKQDLGQFAHLCCPDNPSEINCTTCTWPGFVLYMCTEYGSKNTIFCGSSCKHCPRGEESQTLTPPSPHPLPDYTRHSIPPLPSTQRSSGAGTLTYFLQKASPLPLPPHSASHPPIGESLEGGRGRGSVCCSWNRWEGGERKKAGKKQCHSFFRAKNPSCFLLSSSSFRAVQWSPFSVCLSPLPPPPSKAGRKKGHGKKGWWINIIRVVFAAAASLENRKGGEQKKGSPLSQTKKPFPDWPPFLPLCMQPRTTGSGGAKN